MEGKGQGKDNCTPPKTLTLNLGKGKAGVRVRVSSKLP